MKFTHWRELIRAYPRQVFGDTFRIISNKRTIDAFFMHIGHAIRNELKRQGRTVVWFAETLPCNRSTVYDIFNRSTIDTEQLSRICKLLNHNFFDDLQHEMQKTLQKKM